MAQALTENQRSPCKGAESLALIAAFHGMPADAQGIRHQWGRGNRPMTWSDLLRAARHLNFRARVVEASVLELEQLPLPAIAEHVQGHFFVVARLKEERALVQDLAHGPPEELSSAELGKRMTGEVLLLQRKSGRSSQDPAEGSLFGLRWFVPVVLRHRVLLLQVLAASLFVQLFALITPLFFQVMIDKVLVHEGRSTLHVLAIGMLAVAVFEVMLGGLRTWIFAHTTSRIDVVLSARLFAHLLRLPLSYFQLRRVGDTVARVRELDTIREFITGSSITLVIDLLFTVVFFAVLLVYSPPLAAIVLASIPLYVLLSLAITPGLRWRLEEKFRRSADQQSFIVETITGMHTLKSLALEPQLRRRWEDQTAGYVSASFSALQLGNTAQQLATLIQKVTTVLVLWVGAGYVMQGAMTIGMLVAFNMIAARISGPILRMVQLWQDFQQARIALRRLADVLDAPAEPGHEAPRTTPARIRGKIHFDRVDFRYGPDQPLVLRRIELRVRAGEVIGIVGPSGSGKSTLAQLLQRFYAPERGRILIDGVDLALVDPAWLRRQFGVVLQDNFVFNRSIRENIALSDPAAPIERVIAVAQLAGAHDFIAAFPAGYDTLIGEQAGMLSGGQRQRLAIARALLSDPRILLFDEATSALDFESEHLLQQRMPAICRGRTVLIIAHRLTSLRLADRIIVLEQGEITEQGTHAELLARRGTYARLHALQSGIVEVAG